MASWEEFAALADNYNNGLARWSRAYYDLEARFHGLQQELFDARKSVDRLSSRLIQSGAHAAGLTEQIETLKKALGQASPNHPLLKKNTSGKKWPAGLFEGQLVSNIGFDYIRGFEETLMKHGVKPEKLNEWYIG